MADFPALEPKTRRYTFGDYPITEEASFAGGVVRFRHGTTASGHVLTLGYEHLSATEAKLLRDHYRTQQGGYLAFSLSAEAWAGHTTATDLVPTTTLWRYSKPPEETHKNGGLVDVTVELVSVI